MLHEAQNLLDAVAKTFLCRSHDDRLALALSSSIKNLIEH